MERKLYWKNGFYASDMHDTIPDGAVEITEAEWQQLLAEQSTGKQIVTGADGKPFAEALPEPTLEERKEEAYKTLWGNYKQHQTAYVDAEDLTLAVVCASAGSQMGAAVQKWVMSLWARYYDVKDLIALCENKEDLDTIDLTADSFGAPPYTIRELNEEAASALGGV